MSQHHTASAAVKLVLDNWTSQNERTDKLLASLTDEQLMQEIAPGKNRGVYLLGHLTAVNDAFFPMFGLGEKMYPSLKTIYLQSPDRAVAETPSVAELRAYWTEVTNAVTAHFQKFHLDDWFGRHQRVSEEDFAKEPHRNKLNVLISRTVHQGYHLGQLALLKRV